MFNSEKISLLQHSQNLVTEFASTIPSTLVTLKPDAIAFSVKEIIYHLLEVEELWQRRIHQLIHEPAPHFQQINPDELAKINRYNEQDFHEGISRWKNARMETIRLVEAMTGNELTKKAVHSRYGEMDINRILDIMADHDIQHLRQMERTLKKIEN
jgi:uncharacterized damage-inducible protein DinB